MKKHVTSLAGLFLIIHCSSYGKSIYVSADTDRKESVPFIKEKAAQGNIEFAFDIHETLLQPDTCAQWNYGWEFDKKWELASNIFNLKLMTEVGYYSWHAFLSMIPFLQESIFVEEVSGERFLTLFKQLGQNTLAEFVTTLINKQTVDPEMKRIVIALKNQGYSVRIASNIGKTIYNELKRQFKQKDEDLFDLFDKDSNGLEGKVVDYTDRGRAKPNARYYQEYSAMYNPDGDKLIILIDDKKRNVIAAACHGFIGIHFTTAEQLIKDLQELGIEIA